MSTEETVPLVEDAEPTEQPVEEQVAETEKNEVEEEISGEATSEVKEEEPQEVNEAVAEGYQPLEDIPSNVDEETSTTNVETTEVASEGYPPALQQSPAADTSAVVDEPQVTTTPQESNPPEPTTQEPVVVEEQERSPSTSTQVDEPTPSVPATAETSTGEEQEFKVAASHKVAVSHAPAEKELEEAEEKEQDKEQEKEKEKEEHEHHPTKVEEKETEKGIVPAASTEKETPSAGEQGFDSIVFPDIHSEKEKEKDHEHEKEREKETTKGKEKRRIGEEDDGEVVEVEIEEEADRPSVMEESETVVEEDEAMEPVEITDEPRVLVISIGTRGDVQPYLALAHALEEAGIVPALVTHRPFKKFVQNNGPRSIRFYPLEGDPVSLLTSDKFKHAFFDGSTKEQMGLFYDETKKLIEPNFRLIHKAAQHFQPDIIIGSITTITEVLAVGQKFRKPTAIASTIPFFPSATYAPTTVFTKPFAMGMMNSMMHWVTHKALWTMLGKTFNKLRASIGLGPQATYVYDASPMLCLYSSEISPRPTDWPRDVIITGYWVLPEDKSSETPSKELVDFLDAGEAPVYMGFGSMPVKNIQGLIEDFGAVLKRLNARGIFCGGWSDVSKEFRDNFSQSNPNVLLIDKASHEWLLPRCSVAIHHGGSGTSAASFRAGIPTIIYPVLGDQPFWAQRAADLGVGPATTYELKQLTQTNLEAQIRFVSTDDVKQKAKELGAKLHTSEEDGAANAVEWIKQYLREHPRPSSSSVDDGDHHQQAIFKWKPDTEVSVCGACNSAFNFLNRKHHCRVCGDIFCNKCLTRQWVINYNKAQLACVMCKPIPNGSSRLGDEDHRAATHSNSSSHNGNESHHATNGSGSAGDEVAA